MAEKNHVPSSEEITELLKKDDKAKKKSKVDKKLEMVLGFPLEISVRIGDTTLTIDEMTNLSTGMVIDLNRMIDEPVDLMINGKLIAHGEILTMGEFFGVRITSIIKPIDRIEKLR